MMRKKLMCRLWGIVIVVLITLSVSFVAVSFADTVQPPPPPAFMDPIVVPQYVTPLVIPPVMPPSTTGGVKSYHIAVKPFSQQILPAGFPKTPVFGYGAADLPGPGLPGSTFNYPAFTIEVRSNEKVRVKWINDLVNASGNYVPHILPVDPTLMWANPPGPRDMRPEFLATPGPYLGPVPIVTHVHGAHVASHSDGNPMSWWLPAAKNIPSGYFTEGSYFGSVVPAEKGSAWFEYVNTQPASTLWYHDHAMGMTRLNVYAGMAGFWLIRDNLEDSLNLPGPAPRLGDAPGTKYYEIPMAIQDKMFRPDGSLFYPDSREYFGDYSGPYIPEVNVSPIWNPEFFGNMMLVNGNTWPYLEVEPRKYRFRLLNGCNARTLILKMVGRALAQRPALPLLSFHQIGNEGGLIPDGPVALDQLLMGPAERADVIVDFSSLSPGQELYLINEGPDSPFGGFPIDAYADKKSTGQVMKFKVVALAGPDTSTLPAAGSLKPNHPVLGPPAVTRDLILKEAAYAPADAPAEVHLGTAEGGPMNFMDVPTETPRLGDTEEWRVINMTVDGHPIHLHLVTFEVVGRVPINMDAYTVAENAYLSDRSLARPDPLAFATGPLLPPNSWERGRKDTVMSLPGTVTILKAKFDMPGLYVWHCHIVEHEDNEMMRPLLVMEDQCATVDFAKSSIHVPCLDLGATYTLDLSLTSTNPALFTITGFGAGGGSQTSQCATYDFMSGQLTLPCVDLGTRYSIEFSPSGAPGTFAITGAGPAQGNPM